ncbi:MAG: succinate dehydrogenase, partial [Solirubrobacterales bacterium]|nr:succinate dehydrogenase [Solirubrobacterales bacterium]
PAALAKSYRFVGDPRDAEHFQRLKDLSEDPHGIYDCTHCFNCIDACPKGVDPMSQIMRLRRVAGSDFHINDRNNGHRHEQAFVGLVRDYGLLYEAELLPRSYGGNSWFGKFHPAAGKELVTSLPAVAKGVLRGKVSPKLALLGHKLSKPDLSAVKRLFGRIEGRDSRNELNLYVTGYEDAPENAESEQGAAGREAPPETSAPTTGEEGQGGAQEERQTTAGASAATTQEDK